MSGFLYWPLGEPAGATEAGNIAAGRSERLVVTQVGSGGTLEFGAGTGPGTDDLTAPILTRASAGNGKYLASELITPATASGDTVLDLECFFVTTALSGELVAVRSVDDTAGLRIEIDVATGRIYARAFLNGSLSEAFSTAAVSDGALHHVSARVAISGGNATASIMLDGGSRVTAGSSISGVTAFPTFTRLYAGLRGPEFTNLFNGTLAHVAAYSGATAISDARIQQHYQAGADGFAGEASGARIARYARLAGIPAAEVSTETGLSTSIAHADTTGQSPLEMMQKVATTEDGLVFDGRDGTLTFHSRSHRYGATSAFTLDCEAGEVEADLSPVLDDQGMTNDMTASRANGATIRSVNQASIDENGYYRDNVELMTTSDNEVQSRADWEVNRFGTPRVKLTSITVDLIDSSSSQITALLAADIGTRFTVSNLPSQAPAASMQFFIEGIDYQIGPEFFTVTFNTSAAAYADVWILDSSTQSQLDSTTILAL